MCTTLYVCGTVYELGWICNKSWNINKETDSEYKEEGPGIASKMMTTVPLKRQVNY